MLGKPCVLESDNNNIFNYTNIQGHCPFSIQDFSIRFRHFYPMLIKQSENKLLNAFLCMMYAYDGAVTGHCDLELARSKKLVFQAHHFDYNWINWFSKQFDKVNLLLMVRSPLQSLYSDIKSKLHQHQLGVSRLSNGMLSGILRHFLFGGYRYFAENVEHFAIRLEDLHQHTDSTLRAMAARLGIQADQSLYQSTFSGQPWTNFKGKENQPIFSPNMKLADISDLIPAADSSTLGTLLLKRYQRWDYELDFEPVSCPQDSVESRMMLMEYLPYMKSQAKLSATYARQVDVRRDEDLELILRLSTRFSQPIVELI